MRILLSVLIAPLLLLFADPPAQSEATPEQSAASPAPAADSCQRLAGLAIPNADIAMATVVAAGAFNGPPNAYTGQDLSWFYKRLPAFCRVVAHAHPSADSDIAIEVWLPLAGWNGKLQGVGNGGFAGQIDDFELGAGVAKGYAAVATDTGHAAAVWDASWALDHPEKVADFGYRGIHEMTRVARLLINEYYGSAPRRAYFAGCSDGGREALMEAQRYPQDYDGILAGDPVTDWTALQSFGVVNTQTLTATPDSFIPPAKIPVIAKAVLAACDELDGVRDGILNDPRQCHFDPVTIECKPGDDTAACLTAPQATALRAIYAGLHDASGREIFPGYLPGAEEGPSGWGLWITGPAPGRSVVAALGRAYFSNMVYDDPHWDMKTFSLASGLEAARQKTGDALNADHPDLSAFRSRGGKLILYHGWDDPAIPALSSVNYYEAVRAKMGADVTRSFARLFMLPGVQHCIGGPGADNIGASGASPAADPEHNARVALENWVEKGIAPDSFISTKGSIVQPSAMTRLLCPYPQSAKYNGSGDASSAASYVCTAAK